GSAHEKDDIAKATRNALPEILAFVKALAAHARTVKRGSLDVPQLLGELRAVEHPAPLRVAHVLTKELVYLPLAFKLRFAFERLPVVPRFRFACADRVTKRLRGKRARRRVLFACRRLRRRSRALQRAP